MAEEYAVSVVPEEEPEGASALGVVGVIWNELSGGDRTVGDSAASCGSSAVPGPFPVPRPALQPAT